MYKLKIKEQGDALKLSKTNVEHIKKENKKLKEERIILKKES